MPAPRAGQDRVGAAVAGELPRRWLDPAPSFGAADAPAATLLRWWTDGCPFCEASLPALEALRGEFAAAGLATVAVYHPKPPRSVEDEAIRSAAEARGYRGALAADPDWDSLRAIWLDTGERNATSASFLLDRDGVIRYVHPGPEFHASGDPDHAQCNVDFAKLRLAVRALLAEALEDRF